MILSWVIFTNNLIAMKYAFPFEMEAKIGNVHLESIGNFIRGRGSN